MASVGLGGQQSVLLGCQVGRLLLGRLELLGQAGPLGLEGGHHVGVGRRVEGPGQRALPLPEHAGEPTGPLDHPLGPPERGGQVGLPLGGQLVGRALRVGVEGAQRRGEPALLGPLLLLVAEARRRAGGRGPSSSDPATYSRTARSSSARPV